MSIRSRSCVQQEVKTAKGLGTALAIFLLLLVVGTGGTAYPQEQPTPPQIPPETAAPEQSVVPSPATATPAPQAEAQGSAPLRVMVGKSLLINTPNGRLKRVSVTDPAIAEVQVVTPNQILVHGRGAGEVSLLIWDELERSSSFDLRVDVDVTACAEEEKRVFPDEQITVSPSRSAIVLSGHVSTKDVADRAGLIAQAYSAKVVDVLTSGPVGAQEVLLEVKFAEVDRAAVEQYGINLFSPGIGNTSGTLTTQQFGGFQVSTTSASTTTAGGTTTTATTATAPTIGINDALNLFLFRSDINFGAVIKALEQRNLLQILAEPNLIAVNGKEAKFLAGGQFPFPVVQPGQGFSAVTIQFKNFGVQLAFTPEIMPNGNIHLKVAPEVSTLDFTNGLSISGFSVPALSTRSAETEFELQDGQSFVIAGLMDDRVTSLSNKFPGLGDLPIIGNLFKSKNLQKSRTELMVLCTVRRISPSAQPPILPTQPQPFLEKNKFDGSKVPRSK
jgi:pilus assembly protein CpaC